VTYDDEGEESDEVENLHHRFPQANRDKQLLRLCIEELEKRTEFTELKLNLSDFKELETQLANAQRQLEEQRQEYWSHQRKLKEELKSERRRTDSWIQ